MVLESYGDTHDAPKALKLYTEYLGNIGVCEYVLWFQIFQPKVYNRLQFLQSFLPIF